MIELLYGDSMVIVNKIDGLFNTIYLKLTKIQFLSGNLLKILAMLIMFMDHFTKSFVMENYYYISGMFDMFGSQLYNTLKTYYWPIGSIAFPIFSFLLVEGFLHTKHLKKFFLFLFIFALISEIPFDLVFFKDEMGTLKTFPFYFEYQNVFFTLFLGLTTIWGISEFSKIAKKGLKEKIIASVLSVILIAVTSILAEKLMTDYGAYGVLLITAFYLTRKNRIYQIFSYIALFFIFRNFISFPQIVVSILILLYNGKRGKINIKYFGYIFYPAHLTVLYILSLIKFW